MLIDDVYDKRPNLGLPDFFPGDEILNPLRRELTKTEVYVFDRHAVAMAANVALSKPSSILSALAWIQLPFESIWLEFANMDLRDAMQGLGSPNLQRENTKTQIERSGFLIRRTNDTSFTIDYVHRDKYDSRSLTDIAPVQLHFDRIGLTEEDFPDLLSKGRSPVDPSIKLTGKMKEHIKLVSDDPAQMAANREIRDRVTWSPHPDLFKMRDAVTRLMGASKARQIEWDQAEEAMMLFRMFALPALILLSCKNAIETEEVAPSKAHNKQRRLRSKKPLVVHKLVKIKLTNSQKRRADRDYSGDNDRFIRGTLVSGHFKVRKTGIFWWSPHARQGWGETVKRRIVTE